LYEESFPAVDPSGIYKLKCNTCNKVYVGQSGRAIIVRFEEHIRSNNSTSAYATHILENRHEYGTKNTYYSYLKYVKKDHTWMLIIIIIIIVKY
jgi:hypothetical protein